MPYLMVKHRVLDFERWYAVFKSHAEAQQQAGLCDLHLFRDDADPNNVVCLFKVEDPVKARAFTQTRDAGDAAKKSGVIGVPEVLLLNET